MKKDICSIIKKYNDLVDRELKKAEKTDFVCLTDLLIIKEKIIQMKSKKFD